MWISYRSNQPHQHLVKELKLSVTINIRQRDVQTLQKVVGAPMTHSCYIDRYLFPAEQSKYRLLAGPWEPGARGAMPPLFSKLWKSDPFKLQHIDSHMLRFDTFFTICIRGSIFLLNLALVKGFPGSTCSLSHIYHHRTMKLNKNFQQLAN